MNSSRLTSRTRPGRGHRGRRRVGIFDGFDIAGTVSEDLTTRHPDAARHQRYAGEYELFMEAYRRLEPWFAKL